MKTLLTPQEQIDVLRNIDWKIMTYENTGLCWGIQVALGAITGEFILGRELNSYIPLFTIENANKFEVNKGIYWFARNEQGYQQRRNFVNWMIQELEKEIEQSKKQHYDKIIQKRKGSKVL